jgi:hypothetical protein
MKLEQICCSLENSKRLKELKVKQESLFYHCRLKIKYLPPFEDEQDREKFALSFDDSICSAFTSSELLDMLPNQSRIATEIFKSFISGQSGGCTAGFNGQIFMNDTEANVRAQLIIYLIEKGKLQVEDIE